MTSAREMPPRPQADRTDVPYDEWVDPDGDRAAMFFRMPFGYLIRFPEQADFEIDLTADEIRAFPADDDHVAVTRTILHNSIAPVVGNHKGAFNLHGSAVAIDGGAIAFMGVSRRGKTTLAGAFARAGYPFLTEDVLGLEHARDTFVVQPSRAVLRLFEDSAAFLLGGDAGFEDTGAKDEVAASTALPHASDAVPLQAIFLLGTGECEATVVTPLTPGAALTQLIQHAFVLDVEDRRRLREHFTKLGQLATDVACYHLDYPRRFNHLPNVIESVLDRLRQDQDKTDCGHAD